MAPSYKEMSLQLRKRGLGLLLGWLKDGVLPWGSLTIVTEEIGVACSTISRLWWQARGARKQSLIITLEIASRNNSHANCLKYSHTEFSQGLKEIPQRRRKTYRSTAKAMGDPLSIPHMGKESLDRRGLLPGVLDITPAATAWLNPTMDDDSSLDVDDLDDKAHAPTTTATSMIEMDGEEGENTTTDEITNTGV